MATQEQKDFAAANPCWVAASFVVAKFGIYADTYSWKKFNLTLPPFCSSQDKKIALVDYVLSQSGVKASELPIENLYEKFFAASDASYRKYGSPPVPIPSVDEVAKFLEAHTFVGGSTGLVACLAMMDMVKKEEERLRRKERRQQRIAQRRAEEVGRMEERNGRVEATRRNIWARPVAVEAESVVR